MWIMMRLQEQDSTAALYRYEEDGATGAGLMRIDKADPMKSSVVKMPEGGNGGAAGKAILKLIRCARRGEYPETQMWAIG